MARILHQLKVLGKNVYPYTDLAAVLDNDGRNLKEILKNLTNKFDELELSVSNGQLQGPKGEDGKPGENVEFRKSDTHLQWKLLSDTEWKDLIALNDLIPNGILEDEDGNIIKITDLSTKKWYKQDISDRIIDNLTTEDSNKILSARQGKILKDSIESLLQYIKTNDTEKNIESNTISKECNIEIRNNDGKLEWRKDNNQEWILLLNTENSDNKDYKEYIDSLFNSKISFDLDNDDNNKLLTVKQGKKLKASIDNIFEFVSNSGLGTNVDNDITPLEPEFRNHNSYIQWRIKGSDDDSWINLFEIKNNDSSSIEIEDNLISTNKNKALSANQGRVLNNKIVALINMMNSNSSETSQGKDGKDGKSIEIRNNKNVIQWKYTEDIKWNDLLNLNDILEHKLNIEIIDNLEDTNSNKSLSANQGRVLNNKLKKLTEFIGNLGLDPDSDIVGIQGPKGQDGRNIELQKNYTHIQWRYIGDTQWNDLISIEELKGDESINKEDFILKDDFESLISDNLNDDSSNKILSARQGKILNNKISNIKELLSKLPEGNNSIIENINIIDNLIDGGSDKALSAEQGKIINIKLEKIENFIEEQIKINDNFIMSSIQPGYIYDISGNVIYEKNEWTANSFLQVEPKTVYQLEGDSNTSIIRWYLYSITNGKLTIHSVESSNKKYVTILIPDNCFYIKIGFNTKLPQKTFSHYKFNPIK